MDGLPITVKVKLLESYDKAKGLARLINKKLILPFSFMTFRVNFLMI